MCLRRSCYYIEVLDFIFCSCSLVQISGSAVVIFVDSLFVIASTPPTMAAPELRRGT